MTFTFGSEHLLQRLYDYEKRLKRLECQAIPKPEEKSRFEKLEKRIDALEDKHKPKYIGTITFGCVTPTPHTHECKADDLEFQSIECDMGSNFDEDVCVVGLKCRVCGSIHIRSVRRK